MSKKGKYPVLCAWCEKEGVRTVVAWSSVRGSSGICAAHGAELAAQTERRRAELERRQWTR